MSSASRSLIGVLILGSIQASQRFGATRIRLGGRRRIERCFQPCQHREPIVLEGCGMLGGGMTPVRTLRAPRFPSAGASRGLSMIGPVRPAGLQF